MATIIEKPVLGSDLNTPPEVQQAHAPEVRRQYGTAGRRDYGSWNYRQSGRLKDPKGTPRRCDSRPRARG